MMRSLFSGISGIKSHQTRMDVIGNNVSNINTVGFKSSRVTFSDMLSQTTYGSSRPTTTTGGTNPRQIGLGEAVASIDMIMGDGSAQATGKNTDVALSGAGFMVLKQGDNVFYTRDGAFEFDADGNYVLPGSGYHVQGWNAIDGTLSTTGVTENIVVKAGKTMPATQSTNLVYAGNLDAGALTITGITYTGDPTGDSTAVANDQAVTFMTITYTDGSVEIVGSNEATREEAFTAYTATHYPDGATVPTNIYHFDSNAAGETFRVGANRQVPVQAAAGGTEQRTMTKTIASIDFSSTSYNGNENAENGVQTESVDYHFTTGAFTLYKFLDTETDESVYSVATEGEGTDTRVVITWGEPTAEDSDTVIPGNSDYMMTQSVNVDGTNVIAATLTLSDGTSLKVSSGFYEMGCSVPITTVSTIYDAQGNMHTVTLLTDKASGTAGNHWRTYIAPTAGQKGYQTQITQQEDDGTSTEIYLNRQVTEEEVTPEGGGTAITQDKITTEIADIYFTTLGAVDTARTSGASLYLDYGNGNGAEVTTVAVDFNDITQFSGSSTIYPTTDGNSLGLLNSVAVDVSGVITGTYTNGIIQTEAQIAVAQFANPGGLNKTGTSLYQQSNNSGAARIGTVTDFGYSFTPSALEMSNVELASELVDMIITQRGFQSNSKVITVGDEMLETIVNMKRQ